MDMQLLRNEAIVLFDMWGINDWDFRITKANSTLGMCRYGKKIIEIAEYHAIHDPAEIVLDTLKHEIAHALTFKQFGAYVAAHGPEFKMNARKVGCSEAACGATAKGVPLKRPPGSYYANCPQCSKRFDWYRKPKRLDGRFCLDCGEVKGSLTIRKA